MNRRFFLSGLAGSAFASLLPTRTFPLYETTIAGLQQRLRKRELTAELITQLYLDRIESLNTRGPALRAVLEVNPDCLSIARALDHEFRRKGPRSPLHGVPVLLKDNIDTGDRMQTTAGSLALMGHPAARDAFLVKRLRDAGAVILGKTNLSEWANYRSTHSTSGWSGRGGLTRNPYALDRNPCGSSSGSGVAVSANLCAVAVGTETDGSIVCPSSINGVVGMKPTLGLISRTGLIPLALSQDTPGPMTRTVRDAAILLSVLAGQDAADAATAKAPAYVDYTRFLDRAGLKGARLGLAEQYMHFGAHINSLMVDCISTLRQLGAEIVDHTDLENYDAWRETETTVMAYEFKNGINDYLRARSHPNARNLADLIAFNRNHRLAEMPFFEQELFEQAQTKGDLNQSEYRSALASNRKLTRQNGIDAVLAKYKLDAIIAPTSGPAFLSDVINGDSIDSGCASPAAVAGYPHITVPAGEIFGLPVGLSFFGAAWSEPKLLKYAYAFEYARNARRPPRFLATASLYPERQNLI